MSERRTPASLFSHIFKTPLSSIQAASEILLKHLKAQLNEKDIQLLELIFRNSKTLDLRVNHLLEAIEMYGSEAENALEIALSRDHLEAIHSVNWERVAPKPVVLKTVEPALEQPPEEPVNPAPLKIVGIEELHATPGEPAAVSPSPLRIVSLEEIEPSSTEASSAAPPSLTIVIEETLSLRPERPAIESTEKIVVYADPEIADLIPRFLENRHKDISSIMDALKHGNFDTIMIIGHSMKGAGGGYGFPGVTEIGKTIEEAAKVKNSNAIVMALDNLTNYLDRVEVIYD